MTVDDEDPARLKRVQSLCATIDGVGEANKHGEEYISALAICAGLFIRRLPQELKSATLHQFLRHVRRVAGGQPDDTN